MADTAPVPLVSLVAEVEDPRRPQARLHTLEDMLLIATLAVICGTGRGTEVELLGYQKQVWLATFLALPHGIPSHDTTRGGHRAPGGGPLPREHGHSGSACDAGA